jgi:hypothetical protein
LDDIESIYKWVKDEDRIKDGYNRLKVFYPEATEEKILKWLKDDLKKEYDEVMSFIEKACDEGKITVFRAMMIPDIDRFIEGVRKSMSIGESWAWDIAHAIVYGSISAKTQSELNAKTYILKATANFNVINVDETIFLFLTMNENEIRLYERRKVLLESILSEDGKVIREIEPIIATI